jgi:subtilisin family serine protease
MRRSRKMLETINSNRKKVVAVLFVLSMLAANSVGIEIQKSPGINLNIILNTTRDSNPRMDHALWKLYNIFLREGSEAAAKYAAKRDINFINGKTDVSFLIESDLAAQSLLFDNLRTTIERFGGTINGQNKNEILAALPLSSLGEVLSLSEVKYISLPKRPHEEIIITEGVNVTGAQPLIDAVPYRTNNNPVKVALIDGGFSGYERLLGSELPQDTTLVSFMDSGGTGTSIHGTACAEIVYDMAPDSQLYLLPIDYDIKLAAAVNYCLNNDIKIISTSLCFFGSGPKDGTGPINEIMRWAYENGIIWITAAGNYATRHYSGYSQDPDSNGWHNFSSNDEILDISIRNIPNFSVILEWDDWGTWDGVNFSGTSEDFDLYLYRYVNDEWVLVESGENVQDGNDIPYEEIVLTNPENGHYGISIKRISGNKNVKLHLYIPKLSQDGFTDSQYIVPEQSICSGADSRDAITTGAFNFNDLMLAWYSSWGPTLDGRIKPDISSPAQVSTATYGQYGFAGTSAAAPHLAGAVALLISKLPYTSFEDILAILTGRAIDEGNVGKDNKWGEGRLYLQR